MISLYKFLKRFFGVLGSPGLLSELLFASRHRETDACLGSPVVPFCPFSFWVPLFSTKKVGTRGTLSIKGPKP